MIRIGHRGAAGHAPENTIQAIEKAIALNADFVELDVRRSLDGHLVIIHDAGVDRTTDGHGAVAELTLAELGRLTIANELRIPTLREALKTAAGCVGLLLELKAEGLAEQIWTEVRTSSIPGVVIYASFFHAELLRIRETDPGAQTMALFEAVPVHPTAFAIDAQATHVGLAFGCLTAPFVQALHQADLQVFTYTVNEPADIARAGAVGVDGIISDFPDRIDERNLL
jgi:glycerophosphoryl diester phosphodiesterase